MDYQVEYKPNLEAPNKKHIALSGLQSVMRQHFEATSQGESWSEYIAKVAQIAEVSPISLEQMSSRGFTPNFVAIIQLSEFFGIEPTQLYKIVENKDFKAEKVKLCSVDSCDKPVRAKGLCSTHYTAERKKQLSKVPCSVKGCEQPVFAKGLCLTHYTAQRSKEKS